MSLKNFKIRTYRKSSRPTLIKTEITGAGRTFSISFNLKMSALFRKIWSGRWHNSYTNAFVISFAVEDLLNDTILILVFFPTICSSLLLVWHSLPYGSAKDRDKRASTNNCFMLSTNFVKLLCY